MDCVALACSCGRSQRHCMSVMGRKLLEMYSRDALVVLDVLHALLFIGLAGMAGET